MDHKNDELRKVLLKRRVVYINEDIQYDIIEWMINEIHLMLSVDCKSDIYLLIDTWGGKTIPALNAYDFLKSIPVDTIGVVNGGCKSSGLILLAGCTKKLSLPNSMFHFHYLRSLAPELKEKTNLEEWFSSVKKEHVNTKKSIYKALEDGFSLDKTVINELCKNGELYGLNYRPQEMLKLGAIDEIITKLPFYFPKG